jgi:hypothetical protein
MTAANAHPTVQVAHAWLTGYGDAEYGLDNGERLYGHVAALLAAYRRGQAARHAIRAETV